MWDTPNGTRHFLAIRKTLNQTGMGGLLTRLWKPVLALIAFILAMLVNDSVISSRAITEPLTDIQRMIRNLQVAEGQLGQTQAFDSWVGFLYKHPDSSGVPLNDFKKRVFQPTCKFRRNWASVLPPNTIRPMPAPNAQLANAAYKTFLDGLAQGNQECIAKLNEARDRFMESDCDFLVHSSPSAYNKDFQSVFS